jgi:hypothetical protein
MVSCCVSLYMNLIWTNIAVLLWMKRTRYEKREEKRINLC